MKMPRVIVVHSDFPTITGDGVTGSPAHAFGPFESVEEAERHEGPNPDGCYKFVMDLVGPDPDDIARSARPEPEPRSS